MGSYTSRSSNKGQLSTLDLIVSMMIFLTIVYMFIWSWTEVQGTIWSYEDTQGLRDLSLDIADVLLHTEGYPLGWENLGNVTAADVSSIGLVSEPSVLDERKLHSLKSIPYREVREILGIGRYGYYISVKRSDGGLIYETGKNSTEFSAVERLALLDGEIVKFELRLFRE